MDMEGARLNQSDFTSSTRDVRRLLEEFKTKGVDAVVLDLRRNGGGSLTEAINLTGLFIDQGPVVQVAGSGDRVEVYRDTDRGMVWSGPLVVVISKFSASASEILAGAIQDYHRGVILGDESTHGKGTVQSLLDLGPQLIGGPYAPNLGALKITMQQFFRPNGDSTQLRGVLSDIVLPSVTNYMDVSESDLDFPIDFRHVDPSKFHAVDLVNDAVITRLRAESTKRIKQSDKFARLMKRIDVYREQKGRKTVTLNEKEFMAEREELNSLKEDEKELEKQANSANEIRRDFYLDEVMAIAGDYVRELKQKKLANVN